MTLSRFQAPPAGSDALEPAWWSTHWTSAIDNSGWPASDSIRSPARNPAWAAAKVARIACPKLFIHGRNDSIIPFAMGERLFEAACAPKEFQAFLSDHNDLTARFPKAPVSEENKLSSVALGLGYDSLRRYRALKAA